MSWFNKNKVELESIPRHMVDSLQKASGLYRETEENLKWAERYAKAKEEVDIFNQNYIAGKYKVIFYTNVGNFEEFMEDAANPGYLLELDWYKEQSKNKFSEFNYGGKLWGVSTHNTVESKISDIIYKWERNKYHLFKANGNPFTFVGWKDFQKVELINTDEKVVTK